MADAQIRRAKALFLMFAGAISLMLLVLGLYNLVAFTDSVGFCGTLCHDVMYPQYTAYQASPHSRVACAHCHVGSGADYLVRSKVTGIPLIFSTLTDSYERPIPTPVRNLRPARDTCEQCHRPERFAGDLVRVRTTFLTDETNTEVTDARVLKVGGGQDEVARDIHWHIAANVWFVSQDAKRQEIDWVGVEGAGGYTREYIDPAATGGLTPAQINSEKRLMDCIDCHNRATHIFRSPEYLVDAAMVEGTIDKSLPFIKKEITDILYPAQPSLEQANAALEQIKDFYRVKYPQIYNTKQAAIDKSITEAKNVARLTTFPHMQVTWETYGNNAAHQESPGCFRCHGKLVEKTAAGTGPTIDVSCDLCHVELSQPLK
ncbi:MAG: NapC/NirT family cytochrome c [Dehalococcoidales bacterium]|nr:NapC/NirT family cytochrome c [Dehalococcoidales bacterium]